MSAFTAPWGHDEHPADWAYRTGRVTAESRETWRAEYDANPAEAGEWLAAMVPVLADPTVATLLSQAEQEQERAEAAEVAALFPPTSREPSDLGDAAHLFPPRR